MDKTEQTVGILGGMGPDATVDLMQRIINATPATDDADHIRLLVDNDPKVPSRIKALIEKTGESPGSYMAKMAQGLESRRRQFSHYSLQYRPQVF
ncbi:aspartate/glutamate racemase family protein [Enterovibrio sp. Hal110]